jgi:hypothetical protein
MSESHPVFGKPSMTLGPGNPPEYIEYRGNRYTTAPDAHGHPSVEDWLWNKHKVIIDHSPGGWYVTRTSLHGFPTYPEALAAAVAWAKQQEQQDAK